eukprot:749121-Hanusia_phi.AAC.3
MITVVAAHQAAHQAIFHGASLRRPAVRRGRARPARPSVYVEGNGGYGGGIWRKYMQETREEAREDETLLTLDPTDSIMPHGNNSDLRWCVLVDGSSVSGKAFDSLCYFINGQNTEGRKNEVAVMHAYDKMVSHHHHQDRHQPDHHRSHFLFAHRLIWRSQFISKLHGLSSSMRPISSVPGASCLAYSRAHLGAGRRNYDLKGPGRLNSKVFSLEFKSSDELVKVASLEYAESVGTSEHAPPVVAVILDCIAKDFHADFVFMGSFGVGGKRVRGKGGKGVS